MIVNWQIFINIATSPIKHGARPEPDIYLLSPDPHYLWILLVLGVLSAAP